MPEVRLVCAQGCYLLSPEKATEAWGALKKIRLVFDLRMQIESLKLQRDTALREMQRLKGDLNQLDARLAEVHETLENSYTFSDLFVGVTVGTGVGIAVGVAAVLLIQFGVL